MEKMLLDSLKASFDIEIKNELTFNENEIIVKLLNNKIYKITTKKVA